jgi:radical SAM-linked protein
MRRAELPIAYSQGFHPQPKISLAAALPLGFSSGGEVLDVRLKQEIKVDEIARRLQNNLPADIQVTKVESVDEHAPALQTQVLSAVYEVLITEAVDESELSQRIHDLLQSKSLLRERRGKFYDLRPLIESLEMSAGTNGKFVLRMTLSSRDSATGRPEEVLSVLGIESEYARVERTRLIFQE